MTKVVCIFSNFLTIKISTINTSNFKDEHVHQIRGIRNPKDIQQYLHEFSFNDIKAVLFIFKAENIEKSEKLLKILQIYYKNKSIQFFWCSWNSIFASATLLSCVRQYGDEILSENMNFIFCQVDQVITLNIIKLPENYRILSLEYTSIDSIKAEMFEPNQKLFISVLDDFANMQQRRKVFEKIVKLLKSRSLKYLKNPVKSLINEAAFSVVLNFLGEKPFKFGICQTDIFNYYLTPSDFNNCLISINLSENIPITKTVVFYETFENVTFIESAAHSTEEKENIKISKLGTTVTFSVDKFFQPKLAIQKSSSINAVKDTVIICLNENEFYVEVIKNGKIKKTIYNNIPFAIGFVKGRILIGREAVNAKSEHNSFIVTDLLKLLKTSPKNLKPDPKWGFEITKNDDEILLEFDTFQGRRKATPTFLFAFFIQFSVKNVEKLYDETFKNLMIISKSHDSYLKEQLEIAVKYAKISIENAQIQRYKVVEM